MPNYYFIVPVWGAEYIDTFLRLSLPTQLSPGNLGGLGHRNDIAYRIYTRPQDVETICSSTVFANLSSLMDTDVVPASEITFDGVHHYEPFSACYKLGMKEASRDGAASIFLNADHIWADGALTHILKLGDEGKRVVMLAGPRVLRETFVPAFLGRRSQVEGSAITLSSREAVQWTLDHLHPWDRSLFWDPDNLGRPASFMFWRVGQEGFIMRCFHLHPILVHPHADYPDFPNTIDGSDFVKRVCPRRREVHVVEDSDEVMYFSIAPAEQSAELINRPRVDWRGVVTMVKACGLGSHNLYYLQRTIRFHVGEISDQWLSVERLSDVLVDQVRRAIDNPWKLAYYRLRLWVLSKIGAFLQTNPSFHRILKRTLGMIRTNKSI